jgi:hypothetical protein
VSAAYFEKQNLNLNCKYQVRIQDRGEEEAPGVTVNFKDTCISNFKNFTVNFKDVLQKGGGRAACAPQIHA